MRAWKGDILGSPNIGMFIFVTDEYGIASPKIKEKTIKELEKVFDIEFVRTTILGTDLVGIFINGNSKIILVPEGIRDEEIDKLEKVVKVKIIDTRLNTLGNNMIIGDKFVFINPKMEDNVKEEISRALGLPVIDLTIGKSGVIGSLSLYHSGNILVPPIVKEQELDVIRKYVKFNKINIGTINFGSPFISSGLVLNSNGYAVGSLTTGHELAMIEDTFFEST